VLTAACRLDMDLGQTPFSNSLSAIRTVPRPLCGLSLALVLATPNAVHSQANPIYADVAPVFIQTYVTFHSGQTPPVRLGLDTSWSAGALVEHVKGIALCTDFRAFHRRGSLRVAADASPSGQMLEVVPPMRS
jgi:hypothetical protein